MAAADAREVFWREVYEAAEYRRLRAEGHDSIGARTLAHNLTQQRIHESEALARKAEPAVIGECVDAGDDEWGQPRIVIHTTRESLRDGPTLPFRRVRVTVEAA